MEGECWCQTLSRPSRVHEGRFVYSDIEALTEAEVNRKVSAVLGNGEGWQLSGPLFKRTYPKK